MSKLDDITRKLDIILNAMGLEDIPTTEENSPPSPSGGADLPAKKILSCLTTKRHATLQMLVAGCSNQEIAERLGVSINTVKGSIRSIAKRCGVKNRVEITLMLEKELTMTHPDEYEVMSKGLPIDWHKKYTSPDPYFEKYGIKKDEKPPKP